MRARHRHALGDSVILDHEGHAFHRQTAVVVAIDERKNAGTRYRVRFAPDRAEKYLDGDRAFPWWDLIPVSAAEIKG